MQNVIKKHISAVSVGDVIKHQNEFKTVCASDIKHCKFVGRTIFGDSWRLGYQPVEVLKIGIAENG
jgi:hypothetical protein